MEEKGKKNIEISYTERARNCPSFLYIMQRGLPSRVYNKISWILRETEAHWSILEEYEHRYTYIYIYMYSLWNEGLACLAKRSVNW